jgi:hypothetical protein
MRLPSQAELKAELQRIDGTIVGYLLSKRSPPRELLSSSDRLHALLRRIARRGAGRPDSDRAPSRRRWAWR